MFFLTRFFFIKIERKLALLLSIVALISVVVLTIVAVSVITVTRRENVRDLELQLATQTIDRVQKFIEDTQESFRVVIADPSVQALGSEQQFFILQGLLESHKSLLDVSFLQPTDGFETSRLIRNTQEPPVHRVLGINDPAVSSIWQGKSYLSSVFWTDNNPRIILASAVTNQDQKVIAILRGELSLQPLERLVAMANLGTQGYIYLVDTSGHILATSFNAPSARGKIIESALINQAHQAGINTSSQVILAQYISPITNTQVVALARSLSLLGLSTVVEWPVVEAMGVVKELVRYIVVIAVGLLIILIFLGIFLARRFVRPIIRLKIAAEMIGKGTFDINISKSGLDEVGELAKSFNTMVVGLKELERLKDEFVFIAAHELRTPVTAIRGYAEMLMETTRNLPKEAVEFVRQLEEASARLARLVNDLLEVARSQVGKIKIVTTPQDIVLIINSIITELTPLIAEKNHTMIFNQPSQLPLVLADVDKLKEVLTNLISNAIKYTSAGGRIEIVLQTRDIVVVTTVKDNGIGIAPEDQAKLFKRFFRVESADTRDITGTGLGLFIVRQLIERMGGKIWVESTKGQGSAFSFTLPLS